MGAERILLAAGEKLLPEALPAAEKAASSALRLLEDSFPETSERIEATIAGGLVKLGHPVNYNLDIYKVEKFETARHVYPWSHPLFSLDLAQAATKQVSILERVGTLTALTPGFATKVIQNLNAWNKGLGTSSAELASIRDEVAAHAQAPLPFLTDALRKNRVLAFGEHHFPGEHRAIGAPLMSALKASGATHLALEIPKGFQSQIDQFVKTGKSFELKGIPEGLIDKDYFQMLRSARDSEMKIVAVDSYKDSSGIYLENRDLAMANNISSILDADPGSKVVYWTGSNHLLRSGDTTAAHLARRFPTFTVNNQGPRLGIDPLSNMTGDITASVAIRTSDMPLVSRLRKSSANETYVSWDAVLLHAQDE